MTSLGNIFTMESPNPDYFWTLKSCTLIIQPIVKYRNHELSHKKTCLQDSQPVYHNLSCTTIKDCVMRKSALYMKNKGADQLHGYHTADLHCCFCYRDSTISLFHKYNQQASYRLM